MNSAFKGPGRIFIFWLDLGNHLFKTAFLPSESQGGKRFLGGNLRIFRVTYTKEMPQINWEAWENVTSHVN